MVPVLVSRRKIIHSGDETNNPTRIYPKQIFQFKSEESFIVIRELGFANVCIGLIGILSLLKPVWNAPAAIAGGLYFGLAGLSHLLKKPESKNEVIAMISDIFIFLLMLVYLLYTL